MENQQYKIKLAVLWLIFFCVMDVLPLLERYLPGFLENIIAGEIEVGAITPGYLLLMAFLTLIPPVMAVLSITLKDSINRGVNLIVGIVYGVFMHGILHPIDYLSKQDAHYAGLVLVGIVEFVVAALIVWNAYKWPKKED